MGQLTPLILQLIALAHQFGGMDSETLLGESRIDDEDHYTIRYTVAKLGLGDRARPNLVVRAFDPPDTLLAESPVRFKARPEETVNLTVDREDSAGSPPPTETPT